jgi:hypothetical protein
MGGMVAPFSGFFPQRSCDLFWVESSFRSHVSVDASIADHLIQAIAGKSNRRTAALGPSFFSPGWVRYRSSLYFSTAHGVA